MLYNIHCLGCGVKLGYGNIDPQAVAMGFGKKTMGTCDKCRPVLVNATSIPKAPLLMNLLRSVDARLKKM